MISFVGKKGLVLGIANQRSIAHGVAAELSKLGAELALTYAPDPKGRFERFIRKSAEELGATHVLPLDVSDDSQLEACFAALDEAWDGMDFVVHSVAFADRAELELAFTETTRKGWELAMGISAYSLIPIARESARLMRKNGGGSIVGMTFIGSVLAVPNYHVMGPAKAALEAIIRGLARELGPENIRCNAVSAGALRTLSSSGISQFAEMMKVAGEHAALQRNVTVEEVAQATAFLLSGAASGITGQSIYVDGGFNIMAN
ncbi:MAG: enoyl-ACP reductase [SAR324 cluster bacterium]|nr:enoyl-ACP reductase [SAR324 cluster bacterium]